MKSTFETPKHIKDNLRLPRRKQDYPEREYVAILYEKLKVYAISLRFLGNSIKPSNEAE